MDRTERKILKIARTAQQFTALALRQIGLGPSEYELLHCVRHAPGIHPAEIGEKLGQDRAAITRRIAGLTKKGYLRTAPDPTDGRSKRVYATAQAEIVKQSKTDLEAFYLEWLADGIDKAEMDAFLRVLDVLYARSKTERRAGYRNVREAEAKRHV